MKNVINRVHLIVFSIFVLNPLTLLAYSKPLSRDLPLIGNNWVITPAALLNNLLGISVRVAAILAVIMLAIGGFKYMTSESVFKMGDAKEQIANALIGLLIVLAAFLIMRTINPNLVSLEILVI